MPYCSLKPSTCPCPNMGRPGSVASSVATPKYLSPAAELVHGGALVGVVHEVDVAAQDARVEGHGLADDLLVAGVLLVAQHVHEGAVVDAVHAQRAHEVALQQPEGLGQQERVGHLCGHAVHHLAPELGGHAPGQLGRRQGCRRAGRDARLVPRQGVPETLDVAARQHHGGVEADDVEAPGHLQDLADDRLADVSLEVVELCRVIPGEARAVIAVVDVADLTGRLVDALEDHRRVRRVPVVVLDLDDHAVVRREVRARERVGLEGREGRRDEVLRVLHDPA